MTLAVLVMVDAVAAVVISVVVVMGDKDVLSVPVVASTVGSDVGDDEGFGVTFAVGFSVVTKDGF